MPLFPDEFPFKKPTIASEVPTAPEPVAPASVLIAPETPISQPAAEPVPVPAAYQPEEEIIVPAPGPTQVRVPQERRRSPRQAMIARALVRHEVGNAPGWKVDLLNMSMMGIRFRSTNSMVPGDKAFVKLEVGPVRWATKLRVVHCGKLESGVYAVGCEFVANELSRPVRHAA